LNGKGREEPHFCSSKDTKGVGSSGIRRGNEKTKKVLAEAEVCKSPQKRLNINLGLERLRDQTERIFGGTSQYGL